MVDQASGMWSCAMLSAFMWSPASGTAQCQGRYIAAGAIEPCPRVCQSRTSAQQAVSGPAADNGIAHSLLNNQLRTQSAQTEPETSCCQLHQCQGGPGLSLATHVSPSC